jgi:AcrR family transcriptional regulator
LDAVKEDLPVKRTDDPDGRRAELLAAAARAIARHGFDRLRLRDVADEAGVSIGMLQHYFATREQLGREAFAHVCEDRARRLAASTASAADAWGRVEAYLRDAFAWHELADRARSWIDLAVAAAHDPELRRLSTRSYELWRAPLRDVVEQGVSAGELRPVVPPEEAVLAIIALIDGAEVRVLADEDDDPGIADRTLATAIVVARHLLGAA